MNTEGSFKYPFGAESCEHGLPRLKQHYPDDYDRQLALRLAVVNRHLRTVAVTGGARLWGFVIWSLIFHCLHTLGTALLAASSLDTVRRAQPAPPAKSAARDVRRRQRRKALGRRHTPAAHPQAPLTPAQQHRFQQALLHAFDRGELVQMTRYRLGVDLDAVAGSGTLADVVFALVQWAERQGHTHRLLAEATAANPGNPFLQQFARSLQG